jgi:hypothetical protein
MHAVSLTPHAQKNFRTTSKRENHMQNSDGMHKKIKNACGVNDRESGAQGVLFDKKKTEGRKSRDTVPLTLFFCSTINLVRMINPCVQPSTWR